MPAIYGLGSSVKNSLVANGCIIDGEVENSILFRGVRVEKGAVVKKFDSLSGQLCGLRLFSQLHRYRQERCDNA